MRIKNLIFDLGEVLLPVYQERTIEAFEELFSVDFKSHLNKTEFQKIFHDLECGRIKEDDFAEFFCSYFSKKVEKEELFRAFNRMLGEFPIDKYHFLLSLREKGYKLFLLSNINHIHHAAFRPAILELIKADIFTEIFIQSYFSHEIGLRKPDPEFFRQVLKDHDLNPEQTLFIDDLKENIKGAEDVGIKGLWIPTGKQTESFINTYLSENEA